MLCPVFDGTACNELKTAAGIDNNNFFESFLMYASDNTPIHEIISKV